MFFLRSFRFYCLKANPIQIENRNSDFIFFCTIFIFINKEGAGKFFFLTRETFLVLLAERENSTPPMANPSSSTLVLLQQFLVLI